MDTGPLDALRRRSQALALVAENARILRSSVGGLPQVRLGPSWWRWIRKMLRDDRVFDGVTPSGNQPEDETRFIVAVGDLARELASFTSETRDSLIGEDTSASVATSLDAIDVHLEALPGESEDMLTAHQVKIVRSRFTEVMRILGEIEGALLGPVAPPRQGSGPA